MTDWVFGIVDRLGAIGVGLLILLENLIPPIPSEVILPLAGFRSRTGSLNALLVWPAATAGSLLGALILYALGRGLGTDRLRRLADKPWFILTSRRDLERGEEIFDRHGGKMVLLGRCVPFVRSVISIPAGVARMSLIRFCLLTTAGSAVWNAIFISLGWLLGQNWPRVQGVLGPISTAVLVLIGLALVVPITRKIRNRAAT